MTAVTRPGARVLTLVALSASLLGPADPVVAADTLTGNIYGFADDVSATGGGGPSGSVFLFAMCEASTTGARPTYIDVTCNGYAGGPAGGGGNPSSGPTRNYAPAGTPLDGTDFDPERTMLANPTPGIGKGYSFWMGSSPTPAWVCMDAVAVYSLNPPVSKTYHNCTRLAA